MDVARALRKGSLILGVSALTGCGGGGGGSDGGDTAVALTCESAALAAYDLTLDTAGYAGTQIKISNAEEVSNMLGIYSDVEAGFNLIDDVRKALANQRGDQPVCENESAGGEATLSVIGSGNNTEEQWDFADCVVSIANSRQVHLNGTYRNGQEITDQTGKWQRGEGFEVYDNLRGELVESGVQKQFTIKGRSSLVFEVELNSGDGCVKENVAGLEFELGDSYAALKNSETTLRRSGSTTEFRIGGTLIGSSVGGYLDVSTLHPVVFSGSQGCPQEGIISVSSDGEARVLYGDSAGGTAPASGVAVWINGASTSFESCQSIGVAPLSNG